MDDAKLTPEELEEMEKIVHMVLPYSIYFIIL